MSENNLRKEGKFLSGTTLTADTLPIGKRVDRGKVDQFGRVCSDGVHELLILLRREFKTKIYLKYSCGDGFSTTELVEALKHCKTTKHHLEIRGSIFPMGGRKRNLAKGRARPALNPQAVKVVRK